MKPGTPTRRLAAILLALALAGAACSKGSGVSGTVNLLILEKALLTDVIHPFTQSNPDLKLNATTFTAEDQAVAKLQGGFAADVVYACTTDTHRLVSGGLLQP